MEVLIPNDRIKWRKLVTAAKRMRNTYKILFWNHDQWNLPQLHSSFVWTVEMILKRVPLFWRCNLRHCCTLITRFRNNFGFRLLCILGYGLHRFFKTILELSQNSRHQKGDVKQVPLWDSTNISRHGYLSPCFVHPCYTSYFEHHASLFLSAFFLLSFQLDRPLFIINVPYSLCVLGISFLSPFLLRYSFLFSLFLFCLLDVFLPESIWAKSLVIWVSSGFRRD